MGVLDFVFGIIALIVGAVVVLFVVGFICVDKNLKAENEQLKEELQKARARKLKKEVKYDKR